MNEQEGKRLVSFGMSAAYSDVLDKVAAKVGVLRRAKVEFPDHGEYYDSVIELYEEEYAYCKEMLRIGREMNGSTIQ